MSQNPRILVLGVGSIGERHLRCFQGTGRCELAICEPHAELRNAISQRYGIIQSFPSVDEALASAEFDAAVVATPAPLHVPLSQQLAERGLHLLIEKPVSTSPDGIDTLRDTIAQQQLLAVVGYTHRSHPLNQAVKQTLDEGRFGAPLQAVVQSGQSFAKYRPAYREIYYADRAQGGGAIQDAMTHMYNLGEWLLGPIDRLVTDAAHQSLAGVTVEDTVHTLARHGQTLASYTLNQYQAPNELTLTIVCEKGTVRIEYAACRWSWMTEPDSPWQHHTAEVLERDTLYIRQAESFLDALTATATHTPALCSLDEGLQTLRVNLASLRSVTDQTWQQP